MIFIYPGNILKSVKEVLEFLKTVPKGKVVTYSDLAELFGIHPRTVAKILAANTETEKYSCFKVVKKDGSIGGYRLGEEEKARRLEAEGIRVRNRKVDLGKHGWSPETFKYFPGIFFPMLDDYLAVGAHIGMKRKTKDMERFIYKVRPDGLAVLDVKVIDERIKLAARFLSRFRKIMVVSRKKNGHRPVTKFSEAVSDGEITVKAVAGRFLPGTLTNPSFKEYYEPDVVVVVDPLADKQAVEEAVKMRIPVVALCDTFNETRNVDLVIPVNNKGKKSLAFVFFVMAREIAKLRGRIEKDEDFGYRPEEFEAQ